MSLKSSAKEHHCSEGCAFPSLAAQRSLHSRVLVYLICLQPPLFSCADTQLWNYHHHTTETKEKVFLVITEKEKEKEKALIIMCLHLKIDSRIKTISKMTLRCRVLIGISLSHNAMDLSASILITVITAPEQTNTLTKKDFFGAV